MTSESTQLSYVPSSNTLTVNNIVGDLTGDVTGNTDTATTVDKVDNLHTVSFLQGRCQRQCSLGNITFNGVVNIREISIWLTTTSSDLDLVMTNSSAMVLTSTWT